MIKLSNGFEFLFMAASGSLGFDGRGWPWPPKYWLLRLIKRPDLFVPVIKTLTLERIIGHPFAICDLTDGVNNAVGLTNPGWAKFQKRYLPNIKDKVILSITEKSLSKVLSLADKIVEIEKMGNHNIVGLEFNCSCPNVEKIWLPMDVLKACYRIKERTKLPFGLKIAYHQTHYLQTAKKTQGLVEWLSFNSINWEKVFPGKDSPLRNKFGANGAVSGKVIREINKEMALEIKRAGIKTPVVASSVGWGETFKEGYQDMLEAFGWAEAISFGSLFRRHPRWPFKISSRYLDLEERKTVCETSPLLMKTK